MSITAAADNGATAPDMKWEGDETTGDINGDDKVNILDITALIRILNTPRSEDQPAPEAADVNSDGQVNLDDLKELKKLLLHPLGTEE